MLKRLMTILAPCRLCRRRNGPEMGDDGLHTAPTGSANHLPLDLSEDLAEANAEGKRLMLIVEQRRAAIYCDQMHEEVFPVPRSRPWLTDRFFVVRLKHGTGGTWRSWDFRRHRAARKKDNGAQLVGELQTLHDPVFFRKRSRMASRRGPQAAARRVFPAPSAAGPTFSTCSTGVLFEEGYAGDEGFSVITRGCWESQNRNRVKCRIPEWGGGGGRIVGPATANIFSQISQEWEFDVASRGRRCATRMPQVEQSRQERF